MDYQINPLYGLIFGFVFLPLTCILLERIWPSVRNQPVLREGFSGDVIWYFVQVFVQRVIAPWVVVLGLIVPFYLVTGLPLENYWDGFGPLSELHLLWQALIVYVAYDFGSYWQHRWFHTGKLWHIHAVHHSSEKLDWLSATRFHPLNEIAVQLVCVTPLMCAGISPWAFIIMAPFTGAYAVLLHANLDWDFGPLRRVFASPRFHRWHHTSQQQGRNKNFSGGLPIWDILFGTYYMPSGESPQRFGIDEKMPAGFSAQLLYPFKRWNEVPPEPDSERAALQADETAG